MNVGTFPGFEHLYELSDPMKERPFRGRFEPHDPSYALSRGEQAEPVQIQVFWDMGGKVPGDIIWTTSGYPLVVHGRVVELFQSNGFTGWGTYPVEVCNKAKEFVPDYHGLAITGRCAPPDLSKSRIVLKELPGGWYPYFLGHYFDPASWDGSDLFMAGAMRFVTDRVWRALEKAKIKNLEFCRLTERTVSTDVYTIGKRDMLPPDFEEQVAAAYQLAGVRRPRPYSDNLRWLREEA